MDVDRSADDNIDLDNDMQDEMDEAIIHTFIDGLRQLNFGWIKFYNYKKAKYSPGFVYPPGDDGIRRAKKVTGDGLVTKKSYEFFHFAETVPNNLKNKADLKALKKFNEHFGLNYE